MCTCIEKFLTPQYNNYRISLSIGILDDAKISVVHECLFRPLVNIHNNTMANWKLGAFAKGAIVTLCAVGFIAGSVLALAESIVRLVVALLFCVGIMKLSPEDFQGGLSSMPWWKSVAFSALVGAGVGIDLIGGGGMRAYQCFTQPKDLNGYTGGGEESPVANWVVEKIQKMVTNA